MLRFDQFAIDVAHYRWLGRKTWHPLLSHISLDVNPGGIGGIGRREWRG